MTKQHQEMASGRWAGLSLVEQMANIGSEVERALKWKSKHHPVYCLKAFDRALELFDLTLESRKTLPQLKEIARAREIVMDFFFGENSFGTSEQFLRMYFFQFAYATRNTRSGRRN